MRLRTQLLVSVVIAAAVSVVAGLAVWLSAQRSAATGDAQARAQLAARDVAALLALTQEYAHHQSERVAQQWWQRHRELTQALGAAAGLPRSDFLADLRGRAGKLPGEFRGLEALTGEADVELTRRRRELLVDRLLTDTQAVADGAYRWAAEVAEARRAADQRFRVVALAAPVVLALLIAMLAALLGRGVLRPLASLRRATAAVAQGDLSRRGRSIAADELGDLSRSFDAMTDALERRTHELQAAEQRIRAVLRNAPDAFVGIDSTSTITEWNRRAETTFGWSRHEALGRNLPELLIPPRNRAAHNAGMAHFVRTGTGPVVGNRIEMTALHQDGREIPVELSVAALREGDTWAANAFLHDISERKAADERLAFSERRLRSITDNLPVLIAYFDRELRYRFVNATYERWFGATPEQMLGQPVADLIGDANFRPLYEQMQTALGGERVQFEREFEIAGVRRVLQTILVPDRADGGDGGDIAGLYALSSDITALKDIERRLLEMVRHDALTGLPNRRPFDEKLAEAMARCRRIGVSMAVLYLDIDRFKSINDSLGHAAGDEVLKVFAQRVRASVRETDTVARLAGDEFAIVLEGQQAAHEPARLAQKIIDAVGASLSVGGAPVDLSTSVGIAFYQGQSVAPEAVLAVADAALYEAKRAGRGIYRMRLC